MEYISYEDVLKRKEMFKYVIDEGLMPPWNIDPATGPWKNDLSLSIREKAMLLKWVDEGCPKKSRKPEELWKQGQRKSADVSKESYIVHLPEKVEIPAEGFNEYKRFIISTNFKEDKWVKSVDFFVKPKVIHHMWLFIMEPSFPSNLDISQLNLRDYVTKGFATLGEPEREQFFKNFIGSEDIGYKLSKNSSLALEIHYESIGQKITDDYTHVKITFHKNKPKYKIITYTLNTQKIAIPPYESNYKVKMSYKVKKKRQLISLSPHMHLRGKASSLYIITPQGVRRRIFGVDPYLFNFQAEYELKQPLTVERDSILECVNWFDNSVSNPVNPDPSQFVQFGSLTKDEMSLCHLDFLVPSDSKDKSQWIKID